MNICVNLQNVNWVCAFCYWLFSTGLKVERESQSESENDGGMAIEKWL